MTSDAPTPDTAFKNWFNEARYRSLADQLQALSKGFNRRRFLRLTLDGLEQRALMDRLRQTAIAYQATLPGSYRDQLVVLRQLAPLVGHPFLAISLGDFVAREGLGDPVHSLEALKFFTQYGSSEFAVRPFLQRDLEGTLAVMETWAQDESEHVRRLASEGSRPRLPWGLRLQALVKDPQPTGIILETLKNEPVLYVRKSVANHLNDIAKDHPDAVIERVRSWDLSQLGTAWIVRHGLRTLVKKGDARALALMGASAQVSINVQNFSVAPRRVRLGDKVVIQAELVSTRRSSQSLIVDYVVHYVKSSGGTSAKVFKWTQIDLSPGARVELRKSQLIRDFTTRKHYPGVHRIELQINGRRLASTEFLLRR
ncbi:MAG TPA: DNA alkylation repair protein [Opitutaceae bacterium]|nr:DNA alkylation repair protein [Opitutaceae bacterium]